MTTPDPDPSTTPGLEPGGGVPPGETPPAESSTAAAPHDQPPVASRRVNRLAVVVILGVVAVGALFFVGYAIGLLG